MCICVVIVRDAWQSVGPWLETVGNVPASPNIIVPLECLEAARKRKCSERDCTGTDSENKSRLSLMAVVPKTGS